MVVFGTLIKLFPNEAAITAIRSLNACSNAFMSVNYKSLSVGTSAFRQKSKATFFFVPILICSVFVCTRVSKFGDDILKSQDRSNLRTEILIVSILLLLQYTVWPYTPQWLWPYTTHHRVLFVPWIFFYEWNCQDL